MSRKQTVFDISTGIQIDTPCNAEEELERDAEEAQWEIEKAALLETEEKISALEAKLADDSITFTEMKELMRLRG